MNGRGARSPSLLRHQHEMIRLRALHLLELEGRRMDERLRVRVPERAHAGHARADRRLRVFARGDVQPRPVHLALRTLARNDAEVPVIAGKHRHGSHRHHNCTNLQFHLFSSLRDGWILLLTAHILPKRKRSRPLVFEICHLAFSRVEHVERADFQRSDENGWLLPDGDVDLAEVD